MDSAKRVSRRSFLKTTAVACAAASFSAALPVAGAPANGWTFCAFDKPFGKMPHDELAATLAAQGYRGIEATVRPGGRVVPERVEEDLPALVAALRNQKMEITIMTSGIDRATPLAEKVLRTASKLGIKRYRMLWYRYDLSKPIWQQLQDLRPILKDLVALNKEVGITALYQNHAGPNYVGAGLWDIYSLIREHSPEQVALAYDIRHAQVEAGLNWPAQLELVKSHIGAVCVKDFDWEKSGATMVPLGKGRVNRKAVQDLVKSGYKGPFSVHVEYLKEKDGLDKVIEAQKNDLSVLKEWLAV